MPGIKRTIQYLRSWYGRTASDRFGPLALKAIRQRMVDEGLSRGYINDHVAASSGCSNGPSASNSSRSRSTKSLAVVPGLRKGRTEARECDPDPASR